MISCHFAFRAGQAQPLLCMFVNPMLRYPCFSLLALITTRMPFKVGLRNVDNPRLFPTLFSLYPCQKVINTGIVRLTVEYLLHPEPSQGRLVKQNTMRGSTRRKSTQSRLCNYARGTQQSYYCVITLRPQLTRHKKVLFRKWCAALSSYLQLGPNPPRPVD